MKHALIFIIITLLALDVLAQDEKEVSYWSNHGCTFGIEKQPNYESVYDSLAEAKQIAIHNKMYLQFLKDWVVDMKYSIKEPVFSRELVNYYNRLRELEHSDLSTVYSSLKRIESEIISSTKRYNEREFGIQSINN